MLFKVTEVVQIPVINKNKPCWQITYPTARRHFATVMP